MSKILFISDLHLSENDPVTAEIFFLFLQRQAREAEALYILGDLFEVWVGDDDLSPFHLQIVKALKETTQSGLPIYFMRGNRDFLIGKRFAQMTGVRLLADPSIIDIYGVCTLLMHGDSLCTFDKKHQKTRRFTLNPVCQWLMLRAPLHFRRRIGIWMRSKSRGHLQNVADYIMDVDPSTVEKIMKTYHTFRLIHGHTHRPAIHILTHGERIVLGAWHEAGNLLICDSEQNCQLRNL